MSQEQIIRRETLQNIRCLPEIALKHFESLDAWFRRFIVEKWFQKSIILTSLPSGMVKWRLQSFASECIIISLLNL